LALGPHFVNGRPLWGPFPAGSERAIFAMGCFWGAERAFWQVPGVWVTAVGYCGGSVPSPSYERVCTGLTGHAESVLVVFEPRLCSYEELLKVFWEGHDPTQGMRQGNDVGTQYRSVIFTFSDAQHEVALQSKEAYGQVLKRAGYGPVTTEIVPAKPFYYAEEHHQQYLAKNPGGYCGLGGTGLACPVGVGLSGDAGP
jgi:peptide-methionine (S)-S-oxide reductase